MAENEATLSIKARTIAGASWMVVWRMSTRLLGLVNTVILVRLLAPADFGLVALATTFSQIVESLSVVGVADAIVREKDSDRALFDTGFTINLLRGIAMTVIIAGCAWPVTEFFNDPRLLDIQFVLAGTVFLAALENIGVVEFRRSLAFDKEFLLALLPRIAGIAVSIVCAIVFENYWALIAGIVTGRVLRVAVSYWIHPFRPRISLGAWRRLIGFSAWTWVTTLVVVIRDRIDTLVIGRELGPVKIGVYAVGYEIGSLPSTELVEPLTIALFAGFSAGTRGGADVADGYFKAISATFLLTLPMGTGLAILALPVISLMFGPRWLDAVPLVQVFAIAAMMKVIAYFSGVLLNAHGLIHMMFRVIFASVVVRVGLLLALIGPFGLMGAAMAAAGGIAFEEVLFMIVCFRQLRLNPMDLVRGSWRAAVATGAMATVLMTLGFGQASAVTNQAAAVRDLAGGTVLGAATYAAVLLLLWLICRRPEGAETIFLGVFGGIFRRVLPARFLRWVS